MNKMFTLVLSTLLFIPVYAVSRNRSRLRSKKKPTIQRKFRSAWRKPNTKIQPTYDLQSLLSAIDTEHISVALEKVTNINALFGALDADTANQALAHWTTIDTNMKQAITQVAQQVDLKVTKTEPLTTTLKHITSAIEKMQQNNAAAQKQVTQLTREKTQLSRTLHAVKQHTRMQQKLLKKIT